MTGTGILERPLPRWSRVMFVMLCALVPTAYLVVAFAGRHDLSNVVHYGEFFAPRQLPEIRALHPDIDHDLGYDGQFYAQIALDPSLDRPDLPNAVDTLAYRGQRILLPALAWVLGMGQPRAIVFIYALLNLPFFYLLLGWLWRWMPAASARDFLVVYAIMLTTGSLISVEYALSDLPGAALAFISLELTEISAGAMLALAILTKTTYGLFLLGEAARLPRDAAGWMRKAALAVIAVVPFLLWELHLRHVTRGAVVDATQFTPPFTAWFRIFAQNWAAWLAAPAPWNGGTWTLWGDRLFQGLAQVSLMVQALFLLARPQLQKPAWFIGIAFACLLVCLPDKTLIDEEGYTRSVLPLTIAFNLLLRDVRVPAVFLVLFFLGNAGMLEGLVEMLGIVLGWRPIS